MEIGHFYIFFLFLLFVFSKPDIFVKKLKKNSSVTCINFKSNNVLYIEILYVFNVPITYYVIVQLQSLKWYAFKIKC